jgi:hypothetical protein
MAKRAHIAFICGLAVGCVGCLLATSYRLMSDCIESPHDLAKSRFLGSGTQGETLIHNLTGNQRNGNSLPYSSAFSVLHNLKPMSIENQTLQRIEMVAINYADQSRLYLHDPVFLSMPVEPLQVDPRFIIEHTGLKVPAEFDCSQAFGRNNQYWGVPTMVSILGIDYMKSPPMHLSHDYYSSVPSRWHDCHNLQSYIMSGQKWFIPTYPIVDEEYIELISVYQVALKAKHTFAMVEIGARWGTWGYRAAAAIRRYNLDVKKVDILFMEPSQNSCDAIRKVAEVNEFKLPIFNISVLCEAFGVSDEAPTANDSDAQFRSWVESRPVIDVFDIDCQGCEYSMIPKILDILNYKVRRAIIGDHSQNMNQVILDILKGWVRVHISPVAGGGVCQETLRGPFKWQTQSDLVQRSCSKAPRFNYGYTYGPMINWDGDIILDNPRFIDVI